jgi:pyruvate kinase
MNRRAKIVATIGPASRSEGMIRRLIQSGMDVARVNFSHGSHDEHAEVIQRIRKVSTENEKAVTILQDLSGPKLRTGPLPSGASILLEPGEIVTLSTVANQAHPEQIFINYDHLAKDVRPGDQILLDDGQLELSVVEIDDPQVKAQVIVGGELAGRKGVNLPGVELSVPAFTEKDRKDLEFGLAHSVDAVAMSFVQRAQDLDELRDAIDGHSERASRIPIIAKLEKPKAVDNLNAILEVGDGVMVARGDLGVEVKTERVPSIQKQIIRQANDQLRIVITATQMLDSMINNPRPTRAEASDVANAVFDGSDALMLSGETAVGKYPTESILTMDRIICDAEEHMKEWGRQIYEESDETCDDAIATTHAARALAEDREAKALAVFTFSGRTALLTSKTRPQAPILGFTPESSTFNRLGMLWGVQPFLVPVALSVEDMIQSVQKTCLEERLVIPGDQVVLVASYPVGSMNPPNFTMLHTIT